MAASKPAVDEQTDLIDAGWQSPNEEEDRTVVDGASAPGDAASETARDEEATIQKLPAPVPVIGTSAGKSVSAVAVPPTAPSSAAPPSAEASSGAGMPVGSPPGSVSSPSVASGSPSTAEVLVAAGQSPGGSAMPGPSAGAPASPVDEGVAALTSPTTMGPTTSPRATPSVLTVPIPVAAGLVAGAAVLAGLVGFVGGRFSAQGSRVSQPDREALAAPPSASASTLTPLELAARGEPAALEALEAKPQAQRSLEESLLLGRGRDARLHRRLDEIERRLSANEGLIHDHHTRRELWELAGDARTATRVLELVADWPGPEGPDFLYRVWTATPARTDATRLAEELVYTPELRAKASPELGIALDLRRVQDCDAARRLIPVAHEKADRRALRPLGQLAKRTGCGENEQEDCFSCLREDEGPLTAAIQAARFRRSPNVP